MIFQIAYFIGRIDRKIEFPAPDEKARADILKIHSRKMNLMRGINMRKIAEAIPGASGAEVSRFCFYRKHLLIFDYVQKAESMRRF